MISRPLLLIISLLLSAMLFISSCSQTHYTSSWQTDDFSVLRKSETTQPLRFYDAKSKLQYNISNDSKNIYVCIKVTDELYQAKILLAGMQVNIDTSGKKVQPACILYPLSAEKKPKSATGMKPNSDAESKDNPVKTKFLLEQKEMMLSGFKSPMNGMVPLQNKYGISAHIEWDARNIMYYKAIIPFNTFYKENLTMADSSRLFNFSIVVNDSDILKGSPGAEENSGVNMANGEMPHTGALSNSNAPVNRSGTYKDGMMDNDVNRGKVERMPTDNSFSGKNVIKVKVKMVLKQ